MRTREGKIQKEENNETNFLFLLNIFFLFYFVLAVTLGRRKLKFFGGFSMKERKRAESVGEIFI